MTFDPTKYGLELNFEPSNLQLAIKVYSTKVEELKATPSSEDKLFQKIRDEIKADSDYQFESSRFTQSVREGIFEKLEVNPALSVVLYDLIGEIQSEIKDIRDWYLQKEVSKARGLIPKSENSEDLKSDMKGLREFIMALWTIVKNQPHNIKTKVLTDGTMVPELPQLPKGPSESDTPRGRAATTRYVRYYWYPIDSDEQIAFPAGTMLKDILTDPSYGLTTFAKVYSYRWLRDELETTKQDPKDFRVKLHHGVLVGKDLTPSN